MEVVTFDVLEKLDELERRELEKEVNVNKSELFLQELLNNADSELIIDLHKPVQMFKDIKTVNYEPYYESTTKPIDIIREIFIGECIARTIEDSFNLLLEEELNDIISKEILNYRLDNLDTILGIENHPIKHAINGYFNMQVKPLLGRDRFIYFLPISDTELKAFFHNNIYRLLHKIRRGRWTMIH